MENLVVEDNSGEDKDFQIIGFDGVNLGVAIDLWELQIF